MKQLYICRDYMKEARIDWVSGRRPRDRSLDSHLKRIYVFGSSTPRTLSHLDKIEPRYRVYDAGLDAGKAGIEGKRSKTTSFTPAGTLLTTLLTHYTATLQLL